MDIGNLLRIKDDKMLLDMAIENLEVAARAPIEELAGQHQRGHCQLQVWELWCNMRSVQPGSCKLLASEEDAS